MNGGDLPRASAARAFVLYAVAASLALAAFVVWVAYPVVATDPARYTAIIAVPTASALAYALVGRFMRPGRRSTVVRFSLFVVGFLSAVHMLIELGNPH